MKDRVVHIEGHCASHTIILGNDHKSHMVLLGSQPWITLGYGPKLHPYNFFWFCSFGGQFWCFESGKMQ